MIILRWLLGGLGRILDLIRRNPWPTVLLMLVAALWWQHGRLNSVRKNLQAMEIARDAEIAAHKATKVAYRREQLVAADLDRQNTERVRREHVARLQNVEKRYAINLGNERAVFGERLRTAASRTCSAGSGGATAVSSIPVLSRGPVPAGGEAIVHAADAELGADNTLRLEALIEAWKEAAAVKINQ